MRRTPKQNRLLAALPADVYASLLPDLEFIPLPRGWALHEAGREIEYAYFPTSSIVSMCCLLSEGMSPEVAVIGNDGMVGSLLIMGCSTSTNSACIVQSAGHGYRIRAKALLTAAEAHAPLRQLLLCYVQTLSVQMAQTAVCNRFHSIDQQVCRLLLVCLDRWASHRISLTHERMGNLLGVRREGVTAASRNLASANLISYWRGCVTILDRTGLEHRTCECYASVKVESARLLPQLVPPVQ